MKKAVFIFVAALLLAITLSVNGVFGADFGSLVDRWQRSDGGYVIEIRRIHADGRIEAGYYNPRPINVGRARASISGEKIMIELELRDRGYPGSTYTLVYLADKDVLSGNYYHAPSRQNLSVFFVRIK